MTLAHKTSHKGQFFRGNIQGTIFENLGILKVAKKKNLNIEKNIFKIVQLKFFAMHITNQKLCFDILR